MYTIDRQICSVVLGGRGLSMSQASFPFGYRSPPRLRLR